MDYTDKIDLHIHTSVSDGTDSPLGLIERVKEVGVTLFSVTDHDATEGCSVINDNLTEGDPAFIFGAEFSCKDEDGSYHILGYGYDPQAPSVRRLVEAGHHNRLRKLEKRLDFIEKEFGFAFSEKDREGLFALSNPGKPHIANLLVKRGYAPTKEFAIENYINKCAIRSEYARPEDAVRAITEGGGIPVLAHPSYGRGDELFVGEDMENRLKKLMGFGLKGIEAFYSGFTPSLQKEVLSFAEKYSLYITAGSDYHGGNKLVRLGDTNLLEKSEYPEGLKRFLKDVDIRFPKNKL
ncbi:MAG: PHP domain-containing protein [Clostridia bacterium]|nr:PHP domain-containing protein [Clostridia bacterium]